MAAARTWLPLPTPGSRIRIRGKSPASHRRGMAVIWNLWWTNRNTETCLALDNSILPCKLSFHQCSTLLTVIEGGTVGTFAVQVSYRKNNNTNLMQSYSQSFLLKTGLKTATGDRSFFFLVTIWQYPNKSNVALPLIFKELVDRFLLRILKVPCSNLDLWSFYRLYPGCCSCDLQCLPKNTV